MTTPQQLAQAYDLHLAERWRHKDEPSGAFEQWLDAHWCADGGPEPVRLPDDRSTLGGTANGLRVYRRGEILLGFISGRPVGCYRITTEEVVPPVSLGRADEVNRQRGRPS